MVKYEVKEQNEKYIKYSYYVEGDRDKAPGTIIVDLENKSIVLETLAEGDRMYVITANELNDLGNAINSMRAERGCSDFVEPATMDEECALYGDHAINAIKEKMANGEIPDTGVVYWY